MNLFQALLILNCVIHCDAYNMLWSICKAVFTTMITELQYVSIRQIRPLASNKSIDVSLIIFKGSNIKAHNYLGISKSIQKIGLENGLNIDIKIPHSPYIQKTDNPTFALGHSSGAYDFLMYHNVSKYDGFIQVGSVLNSNGKLPWKLRKLEDFPIPVMTLIGRKDGYLRHPYCLDELYNQNETEKYKTKPIVILKNITHLHISNTSSSQIADMIGFKDIKSSMNVQTAWNMLALCIVDFIVVNSNHSETNSLQRMKDVAKETRYLLHTYLKFDNVSNLKELLAILHMFLNFKSEPINPIYFLNYYDFLLSKPTENSTYFHKEGRSIFSKMYFTPLWIKTKYKIYLPASTINKFIFQQMSNNYQYDTKLKVVFKADKICSTTLEWLLTTVDIEKKEDTIYIQSPVFITDEDSIVYKNFYYMKIVSPAQILELINIDLQDY